MVMQVPWDSKWWHSTVYNDLDEVGIRFPTHRQNVLQFVDEEDTFRV